jgi:hypothetical protein
VTQRRYSRTEFKRGAEISRMDPATIDLARQVLVQGRRQADVAREAGVVRQRISQLVQKMVRYVDKASPLPVGWKADMVMLPTKDWPRVREMEKSARAALARGERRAAKKQTKGHC